MLAGVLSALLLIQLPVKVSGKAADGPSAWDPAAYTEDLGGVPGSWFLLGPALDVVAIGQ